jgi:hypothetical protein
MEIQVVISGHYQLASQSTHHKLCLFMLIFSKLQMCVTIPYNLDHVGLTEVKNEKSFVTRTRTWTFFCPVLKVEQSVMQAIPGSSIRFAWSYEDVAWFDRGLTVVCKRGHHLTSVLDHFKLRLELHGIGNTYYHINYFHLL